MRFYWLVLCAWVRGLFWKWPRQPPVPPGYTGCSCGLQKFSDVRDMYYMPPNPDEHGWVSRRWEPWCFQRTQYGTARSFRIRKTKEEIEFEEAQLAAEAAAYEQIRREMFDEGERP